MTSFTKALYRRDPAAADAFYKHQQFEHMASFGRTPAPSLASSGKVSGHQATFGKRVPSGLQACAASCGHPACKHGCTLIGRND